MRIRILILLVSVLMCGTVASRGHEPLVVTAILTTSPLFNYEGAPATPDADDPAIWWNRGNPRSSLIIGTAKDAGLLVYDLSGELVQALLPPNPPQILDERSRHTGRHQPRTTICRASTVRAGRPSAGSTTLTSLTTCDWGRARWRNVPTSPWFPIAAAIACGSTRSSRATRKDRWSTSRPPMCLVCSRPVTSSPRRSSRLAPRRASATIRWTIRTPSTV